MSSYLSVLILQNCPADVKQTERIFQWSGNFFSFSAGICIYSKTTARQRVYVFQTNQLAECTSSTIFSLTQASQCWKSTQVFSQTQLPTCQSNVVLPMPQRSGSTLSRTQTFEKPGPAFLFLLYISPSSQSFSNFLHNFPSDNWGLPFLWIWFRLICLSMPEVG